MAMPQLLDTQLLEQSAIVANCRMNRERCLGGSNGYSFELGFHPLEFLRTQAAKTGYARWLDLCCGSGKALLEAARIVDADGSPARIEIVGVDLVNMFVRREAETPSLRLIEASLTTWSPDRSFDLITCVHGLHYVGDKLASIARAASWLTQEGFFAATLDLSNLRLQDGQPAGRRILADLRQAGLQYDRRKRLLKCHGFKTIALPYRYLGADDNAGPNFTGQPAVDSYYELESGT